MTAALKAGLIYFAIVFAAGFVLGTIRVLLIIPRIGETYAVLLELPVILLVSWLVCGWLLRRFTLPPNWRARLSMGAIAFALLMIAELALSVFVFNRSVDDRFASYLTFAGSIGLGGQLAFAAMPLIRLAGSR